MKAKLLLLICWIIFLNNNLSAQEWIPSTSPKYKEDPVPDETTDLKIVLDSLNVPNRRGTERCKLFGTFYFSLPTNEDYVIKASAEEGMEGPLYPGGGMNIILDEGAKVEVIPFRSSDVFNITKYKIRSSKISSLGYYTTGKIEFNINSGKIQIINGQPKFIRDGIFILWPLIQIEDFKPEIQILVKVCRNAQGEYKRGYNFAINKDFIGKQGFIISGKEEISFEIVKSDDEANILCDKSKIEINIIGDLLLKSDNEGLLYIVDK